MGGANNICSDKTGTLTMNKMTCTNIWSAGNTVNIKVNDEQYVWQDYFKTEAHFNRFKENMCLNTIGNLENASATEMAMLIAMQRFGIDFEAFRK